MSDAKQTNKQTNYLFTYQDALKKLTPREIEVLDLVERGFTNKEIALEMSLSIHTVKTHRKNIHSKLDLKGRNALIKWLWWSRK